MVRVEADGICVLVWKDNELAVGTDVLGRSSGWVNLARVDEVYGPFGGWDEAWAFERGLQLPEGQHSLAQVLRSPKLNPHGVKSGDFKP